MNNEEETTVREYRNPTWNQFGGIDVEINHERYGWIPYSVIDQSGEKEMQAIYDAVMASTEEPASYVEPDPIGAEVNQERVRRIMRGSTFTVTDYGPIRLQGDPATVQNLDSLALKANLLIAQQQGSTITEYRDADNIIHPIDQHQVLELWSKAGAYIEECYKASWTIKDNPPIPKDFRADAYWP